MGGNLDDQPATGCEAGRNEAAFEQLGDVVLVAVEFPIRRICENEIVASRVALEEGDDLRFHRVATVEAGLCEVFVDDGDRLSVLVDEGAVRGATTERFKAKCAGTREKIEYFRAFHPLADDAEEGLADEVRGRSGNGGRDLDGDASGLSGNDSHGMKFTV